MTQLVKVKLGVFAAEALAGEAGDNGHEPRADDVLRAINFYLNDKGVAGAGWAYPPFRRKRRQGPAVELELSLGDELWRSLKKEAGTQRVTVEQLLEHAALYYAAELDAGHVAERMLGDVGKD